MKFLKYGLYFVWIFLATMLFNMWRFGYGVNDGFWRTLLIPCEGTIWAKDFSEKKFNQLKLGMSINEVKGIIGEPLKIRCGEEFCYFIYTDQDTGTADHDERVVVTDLNHKVVEIKKSFFID
jgi:hypothetical protein